MSDPSAKIRSPESADTAADARLLSSEDFLMWGVDQVVYIRPLAVEGRRVHAVFAANGAQIAFAPDSGQAASWARENELVPLTVH